MSRLRGKQAGAGRLALPVLAASILLAAASPVLAGSSLDTPEGMRAVYESARGRVVGVSFIVKPLESETGVEGPKSDGVVCGVVMDGDGLIMIAGDIFPETGADPRAIMAPSEFKVHFGTDTIVPAEAIGLDRRLNLAFIRVDPGKTPPLHPASFTDDPALRVGDPVVIVGVLGRKYGFAPALYRATVNASVEEPLALYGVDAVLQDLAVGGLVLRMDGSLAGVVANDVLRGQFDNSRSPGNFLSLLANTGQPQVRRPGYAMVLPAPAFRESAGSPPPIRLTSGKRRGWVGIVMQALNEDLIEYWELPVPGGIIIGSVLDGSPAQAAGLLPGDILTRFDGDPLRIVENSQLSSFRRRVEAMKEDDVIDLEVYREGSPIRIPLTLGNAPKTAVLAEDYEDDDFGLKVREITLDVRQAFNLEPDMEGIVVERTEDAGWADVAGLSPQDIILELNGTPVRTISAFRETLDRIKERQGPEAIFFVLRPPETRFVRVRTGFER